MTGIPPKHEWDEIGRRQDRRLAVQGTIEAVAVLVIVIAAIMGAMG